MLRASRPYLWNVVTQASLYPLWFDGLLQSSVHVLRARADLADLGPLLRTATGPAGEPIAHAGRRRLCQLMHLPHLARFVSGLLHRYSALFDGQHSARLHHAVRQLSDAGRSRQPHNRSAPRTLLPERLWSEIATSPPHCYDVWWRDPRCDSNDANPRPREEVR